MSSNNGNGGASSTTMEPMEVETGNNNGVANGTSTTPTHSQQQRPFRRQVSNISLPKKKSNISGASSNLVNSIVGAGIIGIPFAFKESGLIAGIILLLFVSYFTDKSLRMLIELASFSTKLQSYGVLTFEDLLSLPYGRFGTVFVLTSMFITAYGAMVAYLLIIKDTLPVIFGWEDTPGTGSFMERELVMLLTSLFVVVPLSMQRDFSSLAFTSFLSVICDTLLVVFVAIFSPIPSSVANAGGIGKVLSNNIINPGFFIGFGVLTIAMTCQHSAFIVAGSVWNLTPCRWARVTMISLSISAVLCLILGICGFLGFLQDTKGDVLNNFAVDTIQANAARALLALTMFFTYPMEAFVARHVLVQLLFGGDMDGYISTVGANGESVTIKKKFCGILNRRHQVTLGIYVMTLIPALIVNDLGPVLSITGAIGGCCLAYISPGLAYLGVHGDSFLAWVAGGIESRNTSKASKSTKESDLPLEGDATAQVTTTHVVDPIQTIRSGSKPFWWYLLIMPLWVSLATTGSQGMNERLTVFDSQHGPHSPDNSDMSNTRQINGSDNVNSSNDTNGQESETVVEPIDASKRDYFFSIFFIFFGVIAMIAGIVSNVFVQVNHIFYTPT